MKAVLLLLALMPGWLPAQDSVPGASAMAGISNKGKNLTDPYVTAGDRAYLIGTQDGNFPDLGEHFPGEMGGLWVHPIKLIDGFKAAVLDSATRREADLEKSAEFINYPYGNRFKYGKVLDDLEIERFQFSPDGHPGVVVQYRFINTGQTRRNLRLRLTVGTDLLPVWASEKIGITDAADAVTWQPSKGRFRARDSKHRWFALWGPVEASSGERVPDPPSFSSTGMGVAAASSYPIAAEPRDTAVLTFVFAGSTQSSADAERAFTAIATHQAELLQKKQAHYARLIDRAQIRIPDGKLQQVYDWVRINTEWLVRDVPGMGRGVSAGLPEYPWWFGTDGAYTMLALIASGDFDLVKQTLRLLRHHSARTNGNGRIIHEVTTNGVVYNPGNTQETAHFIMTVGKTVRWTGDLAFAREMYPAMKQGLHWLLADMDPNHNLFPGGYGVTEISGLNAELIDVAVYTGQALRATAEVGRLLGDRKSALRYERLADDLNRKINGQFWLEDERSYADFYGTRDQAVSAAEGMIKQIGLQGSEKVTARDRELIQHYRELGAKLAALPDTTRGWITNRNWVVATPMEMAIAPRDRAIEALDRIRKEDVGEYGPFLSGVNRGAMMTISTGVLAVAEARYGRMDESLWYVNRIAETFGRKLPGSMSEMMPDYGDFVQAWTIYGIVVPLVEHVFGVTPDAVAKTVTFEPHLPKGWEDIGIADLRVGSNSISFSREKTGGGIEYRIGAKEDGWRFVLRPPESSGVRYELNGKPVQPGSSGIEMNGRKNRVLVIQQH